MSGCAADETPVAQPGETQPRPAPTTQPQVATTERPLKWPAPTFRPGDCPMPIPPDVRVECGTVDVPENRSNPNSPMITLAIAHIHSRSSTPKADPVVNLEGGPGYPSLETIAIKAQNVLLDDRDYYIWDQRGLGFSTPNLNCPEVDEAIWNDFADARSDEIEGAEIDMAMGDCHDRLVADGVDLSAYNTTENASDLADLRVALGIDEWNLRGVSYGSALAIETIRNHPVGLRSVLLDSVVVPDQAFGATDRGRSAVRAFDELFAACAADVKCSTSYGDLKALAFAAAKRLDESPYKSTVTDPQTGTERQIAITGNDLWAGLFNAMYDNQLIGLMPGFLKAVAEGHPELVNAVAADGIPFALGAGEAMTASVTCTDRQRLLDPAGMNALVKDHPELSSLLWLMAPEVGCTSWAVKPADPMFNTLLTAPQTVPVLVMAGRFDPITPPSGSKRVAEALEAPFLLFPNAGHGAIGSSDCARMVWGAFMDDPAKALDTHCIDNELPIDFK